MWAPHLRDGVVRAGRLLHLEHEGLGQRRPQRVHRGGAVVVLHLQPLRAARPGVRSLHGLTPRSLHGLTTRSLHGHYAVTTRSHYVVTTRSPRGHYTVTTRSLRGHYTVSLHGRYAVPTRSLRGHYADRVVTYAPATRWRRHDTRDGRREPPSAPLRPPPLPSRAPREACGGSAGRGAGQGSEGVRRSLEARGSLRLLESAPALSAPVSERSRDRRGRGGEGRGACPVDRRRGAPHQRVADEAALQLLGVQLHGRHGEAARLQRLLASAPEPSAPA